MTQNALGWTAWLGLALWDGTLFLSTKEKGSQGSEKKAAAQGRKNLWTARKRAIEVQTEPQGGSAPFQFDGLPDIPRCAISDGA